MNPLLIVAGLGALALLLFSKKSDADAAAPGTVTIKVPEMTITPGSDTSPTLTVAEQTSLDSDTADVLYQKASGSSHRLYVAAASAKLLSVADPRAAELAQRVAQWSTESEQ